METYSLLTNALKTRMVTENGRRYIVAPLTMIVPGVLPGSKGPLYYPPEQVANNYKVWNHTPIVVYHPTDYMGNPLSARYDSGVIEKSGIGTVRNSYIDNQGKLKAEGWFDEQRTAEVDSRILDSLRSNRPIELSTGLFTDNVPAQEGAVHNGRPYDYIATNYRPDHLAILPDQVGACSLNDGCGVLVNKGNDSVTIALLDNTSEHSLTDNLGSGNWHLSKRKEHAEGLSAAADKKSEEVSDNDSELEAYTAHKDAADAHRNAARTAASGAANGGTPDYEAAGYHGNKAAEHAEKAKKHGDNCAMTTNDAGEEWITISGTHVKIDGSGNIIGGPEALKKHSAKTKAAQHGPPKPDRSTGPSAPHAPKEESGKGEQGGAAPKKRHELPMADMKALPVQHDEPAHEKKSETGKPGKPPVSSPGSGGGIPAEHKQVKAGSGQAEELKAHAGKAAELGVGIQHHETGGATIHGSADSLHAFADHIGGQGSKALSRLSGYVKEQAGPKTTPLSKGEASVAKAHESGDMRAQAGAMHQHSPEEIAGAAADEHGAGIGRAKGNLDKTGVAASKPVSSDSDISHYAADALSATATKRSSIAKKVNKDRQAKEHGKASDAHLAAAEAHEKAGNIKQAEFHMSAAIEHQGHQARLTSNKAWRRFINNTNPNGGYLMTRQKAIHFLVTNCACWRGPDDREVLNTFSDAKLEKLVEVSRRSQSNEAVVNAVSRQLVGNGSLTLNAMPPVIQAAIQKKAGAAKEGGDPEQDKDKLNEPDADDETASDPSGDEGPPDTSGRDNSQEGGKPPVNQKPVGNRMTDEQWLASAPPRVQELLQNALTVETNERKRIINKLISNVRDGGKKTRLQAMLAKKSLNELRDLAELGGLVGNSGETSLPNYSLAPGYIEPTNNVDDQEDLLPIPTINWAEKVS